MVATEFASSTDIPELAVTVVGQDGVGTKVLESWNHPRLPVPGVNARFIVEPQSVLAVNEDGCPGAALTVVR